MTQSLRARMRLIDELLEHTLPGMTPLMTEGGNAFKDTSGAPLTRRIAQQDIAPTVKWLERITGLDLHGTPSPQDGLPSHWLGSTGRKSTGNGDLDLLVNDSTMSKEQLIQTLTRWVNAQPTNPPISKYIGKSGINVHFLTPIKGNPENGYVQTDFMFIKNPAWAHFSMHAPSGSAYSGADRAQMINSLAKAADYKLNASEGIKDRATDTVITSNPDKVAKLLLNPTATRKDLASVETILAALKDDPKREEKLVAFRGFIGKTGRTIE